MHISGVNPIARKDNLVEVQWDKLKQIINISNKYNVPIVTVGDIFDTPIIANSLLQKFGNIISKLNKELYFVFGNHDLIGHSIQAINRTSLGVIESNNPKIKHIKYFYSNYGYRFDYSDYLQPIQKTKLKQSNILLCHKAVVFPKLIGGKNSWILKDSEFCYNIQTEKELHKYSLILCGHWHKPYIFTYKNTKVINAGSVLRTTINETHQPSIYLLNLKTLEHKKIKLNCNADVLSDKHLQIKKSKTINIDNVRAFVNSIGIGKKEQSLSIVDSLLLITRNLTDQKLVELIEKTIAKVKEAE